MGIVKPQYLCKGKEYWLEMCGFEVSETEFVRVKLNSIDKNYKHELPLYGKYSYDFFDAPYDDNLNGRAFYRHESMFNETWRTWDTDPRPTFEERAAVPWRAELRYFMTLPLSEIDLLPEEIKKQVLYALAEEEHDAD